MYLGSREKERERDRKKEREKVLRAYKSHHSIGVPVALWEKKNMGSFR